MMEQKAAEVLCRRVRAAGNSSLAWAAVLESESSPLPALHCDRTVTLPAGASCWHLKYNHGNEQ